MFHRMRRVTLPMLFFHVYAVPDEALWTFPGQYKPSHGWLTCDLLQLSRLLFALAVLYGLVLP